MIINVISKNEFEELIQKVESINSSLNALLLKERFDGLLTNKKVSELLNVSSRTLQTYRDSGQIEFSQIGRKIFYREEAIQKFLNTNKITVHENK
jgi:hypothetical protein